MATQTPAVYRRKQVETIVGVSRTTIYRWLEQGIFPRPIPIGPGSVGWLRSEVDAWLNERIALRDAQVIAGAA